MPKKKLKEENSWKVFFFTNEEEYEGYLFVSGLDADNSAREFCKYHSPKNKAKLANVNKQGIKYVGVDSDAYSLVIPPEFTFTREFFA